MSQAGSLSSGGSGGSGIETIDGDVGSVTGSTVTFTGQTGGVYFDGSGTTMTVTNLQGVEQFVVSPDLTYGGGYTTIGAAITAAAATSPTTSNPVTIWIRDGTYTEDVALTPFINLSGAAANSQFNTITSGVLIVGTMTFTPVNNNDNASLTNLILTSNGGDCLTNAGTAYGAVNLTNVDILPSGNFDNANGITGANGNVTYNLYNCFININGDFSSINTASSLNIYNCEFNGGNTNSVLSGGAFCSIFNSQLNDAFTLSDTSAIEIYNSGMFTSNGTAVVVLGSTNYAYMYNVAVGCNNATYAVSGTGYLYYDLLNLTIGNTTTLDPGLTVYPATITTGNFSFDGGNTILQGDGNLWIGNSTTHLPTVATLTAGSGISITNAPGSITIAASGGGGVTINGDTGYGAGSTLNLITNTPSGCGGTVSITGDDTATLTVNVTDGSGNTCIGMDSGTNGPISTLSNNCTGLGQYALRAANGATACTAIGYATYISAPSDSNTTAVGAYAMETTTASSQSTAVGAYSMEFMQTGVGDLALGYQAGYSYGGSESYNVCIASVGVISESSTLHIGDTTGTGAQNALNAAYIQGISGNAQPTSSTVQYVTIDTSGGSSNGLLGVAAVTYGSVALMGGSATVSTTAVTSQSLIFLTPQNLGTVVVPTAVAITATVVGTSFTITSANMTDTSTIAWQIVN